MGSRTFYHRDIPAKRGISPRLFLVLADRQNHEIGEFYDYLAGAIDPQIAVKQYVRSGGRRGRKHPYSTVRKGIADNDPEVAVEEGKRILLYRAIRALELQGYFDIAWPEREARHTKNHTGFIDVKRAMIRMTDKGWNHFLNGTGIFAKVIAEVYLGVKRGTLTWEITLSERKR